MRTHLALHWKFPQIVWSCSKHGKHPNSLKSCKIWMMKKALETKQTRIPRNNSTKLVTVRARVPQKKQKVKRNKKKQKSWCLLLIWLRRLKYFRCTLWYGRGQDHSTKDNGNNLPISSRSKRSFSTHFNVMKRMKIYSKDLGRKCEVQDRGESKLKRQR